MSSTPDEAQQYAALERELSQPDSDPAVARIEAGEAEPVAQPERPEPQEYSRERHGEPEPQQQQQQQQQPPQQYRGPPDVNDDPIGHFAQRQAAVEAHLTNKEFWDGIKQDEDRMRQELPSDYEAATDYLKQHRLQELAQQFPDRSQDAAIIAHRHGFQSPAHMRMAILQNDAMQIANHAFRNGQSPAEAYFQHAVGRGYKPQAVMSKSVEKAALNVAENGDDKQFDEFWRWYERAAREQEARRR